MKSPSFKVVLEREKRSGVDVSDISVYICLIDIRSKSKEQLNERRAGLSNFVRSLLALIILNIMERSEDLYVTNT